MTHRRSANLAGIVILLTLAASLQGGWLSSARAGSLIFPSPELPPVGGKYAHPGPVFWDVPGLGPIELRDIVHCCFTDVLRLPAGDDQVEQFNSTLVATLASPPVGPIALQGPVQVKVFGLEADADGLGTFDTEIVSMSLTGVFDPTVVIRESPAQPSLGQTTITDIGGGLFQIESFFDVFVELSLDGGASFIPQRDGPSRVTLVPAPASLLLLGLGAAGVLGRRLLRRKPGA